MKKFLICLFAILFLGCATAYQPMGFKGGYEEIQLDDNVFKITFRGNGYTSKGRVNDYNLLRCSEIALQNNFKYFVIKNNQDFTKTSRNYVVQKNYSYSGYNNGYTATENSTTKARIENTIECYKEKPNTENTIYNAEITLKNIKQKYNIQ